VLTTTIALLLLGLPRPEGAIEEERARAPAAPPASLIVAAVGDVLLDGPLHRQAGRTPEGFQAVFAPVAGLLQGADLTYANLEGPLGGGPTAGFPRFNHPDRLADDLLALGVDVVSTANNHSLDRGRRGLERTLDRLDAVGLAHAGTRRSAEERWFTIVERQGFRVAFVACTFAANGQADPGRQVLRCYGQRRQLLALVRTLDARDDVDAVIVTPHIGLERLDAPRVKERRLAQQLVEAGALAVLGAHPHKLHRVERLKAGPREAFVAYSLGNAVSGQRSLPQRTGAVVYLRLVKTADGVVVDEVAYTPLVTRRTEGQTLVEVAPAGSPEAVHAARVLKGLDPVAGPEALRQRSGS
jgi:poly-gamma-glutamate capsule biosynthesis protein CapA/YwtB (metallophosphatase superfamily)